MYKSMDIASYFVNKGIKEGRPISPMKVQKLVYMAHGWNLAMREEPLIEESVQAWSYGPVIPNIYYELKKYGNSDISDEFSSKIHLDSETLEILDFVWTAYSKYSAIHLSNMTHEKNTPWEQVMSKGNGSVPFFTVIDNKVIKEHYQGIYNQIMTPVGEGV